MTSGIKKQDIDLWEAWIEYDQYSTECFGTLYILGEILIPAGENGEVVKIENDKDDPRLILRIPERPRGRCRAKEVLYSEPIINLSQYTSICIYAGEELVTAFDEIEVLI
jgi:hypothetical protein